MNAGEVYIVHTVLTRPKPKDKIVLCICAADNLFVWINTKPAQHGIGQFPLKAVDHPALSHDCYLDISRATTFPERELLAAKQRGAISPDLAARLLAFIAATPPKTLAKRYLDLLVAMLNAVAPPDAEDGPGA